MHLRCESTIGCIWKMLQSRSSLCVSFPGLVSPGHVRAHCMFPATLTRSSLSKHAKATVRLPLRLCSGVVSCSNRRQAALPSNRVADRTAKRPSAQKHHFHTTTFHMPRLPFKVLVPSRDGRETLGPHFPATFGPVTRASTKKLPRPPPRPKHQPTTPFYTE
ncbi:hypothetical protein IWZ01DRAFT_513461 [Phyllosticta capitalensis]